MEQKVNVEKIRELENEILSFKEKNGKNKDKKYTNNTQKNASIVYSITAELFGGVITAFILNKLYTCFFGKSVLVFALLLFFCSIAGLYNLIKIYK